MSAGLLIALAWAAVVLSTACFEVTTIAECEAYLCKYGYAASLNCSCSSLPSDTDVMASATWSRNEQDWPPCLATHFSAALAIYQKSFGIDPSGDCDAPTKRLMSEARCGQVDDFATLGDGNKTVATVPMSTGPAKSSDDDGGDEQSRQTTASQASGSPSLGGYAQAVEAEGRPISREALARLRPSLKDLAIHKHEQPPGERGQRNGARAWYMETDENRLAREWAFVLKKNQQMRKARSVHKRHEAYTAAALGRRRQRSHPVASNDPPVLPPINRPIKWRILSGFYSNRLTTIAQESAMELAFRKWAAVTPLCFVRDQSSDVKDIDIQIAFVAGDHIGDSRRFDGVGGELAHSYPGAFTHFDQSEPWNMPTDGSNGGSTGRSLLAVAIHEFGHVLGLGHSQLTTSVMHSIYSDRISLSTADLAAAEALYGQCTGKFDAVVDVMFSQLQINEENGEVTARRYYSTMFFRGSVNWLYKNSDGRPPEGEPMMISSSWTGIPNSVDAVVQYSKLMVNGSYVDILLFFKGSRVYWFDYDGYKVVKSATISGLFPSGKSGQPIPNNLDSAYYNSKDDTIYFFKDSLVYGYHYDSLGSHSCCEFIRPIAEAFPLASEHLPHVHGTTHLTRLDATYLSSVTNTLYFFVDDKIWIASNASLYTPANSSSVSYMGLWNKRWKFICEVDC